MAAKYGDGNICHLQHVCKKISGKYFMVENAEMRISLNAGRNK
jgi:hypothetical protein